MGQVNFNAVSPNVRAPLFYAEINAGPNAYQGQSRMLLIGQRLASASLAADKIQMLGAQGEYQSLCGVGSMLTEMADYARRANPIGEIWVGALADPAGVAHTKTVTIGAGILGNQGTLYLYMGGVRLSITVASTDTNIVVAGNLATAINAGYTAYDGSSRSFPFTAANSGTNVVTLTSRHVGAVMNDYSVDKDLVGDEGSLAQYVTVADGTAGTGVPTLTALLAELGDKEFDLIAAPYSDTTTMNALRDFLDGVSGRWSPAKQLYGHYITAKFDTQANLASFGSGRNNPNETIMGVNTSPSPPWQWAASICGVTHNDKNLGLTVDQAYRISKPLHTLQLPGIKPPKTRANWFALDQRNALYFDGISGYTVTSDGIVQLDRVITTYQLNAWSQPDITWLDIETRLQMVYFVRYVRQRITQKFGRHALADDNPSGNPGIVTPKIIKAELVHCYEELVQGGLVEKPDQFAKLLIVERSADPNRVNAYLPVDTVNQFRIFAANVTAFLQYPAAA